MVEGIEGHSAKAPGIETRSNQQVEHYWRFKMVQMPWSVPCNPGIAIGFGIKRDWVWNGNCDSTARRKHLFRRLKCFPQSMHMFENMPQRDQLERSGMGRNGFNPSCPNSQSVFVPGELCRFFTWLTALRLETSPFQFNQKLASRTTDIQTFVGRLKTIDNPCCLAPNGQWPELLVKFGGHGLWLTSRRSERIIALRIIEGSDGRFVRSRVEIDQSAGLTPYQRVRTVLKHTKPIADNSFRFVVRTGTNRTNNGLEVHALRGLQQLLQT